MPLASLADLLAGPQGPVHTLLVTGMVVEGIGQLVLAGIAFAAYRQYRRSYLVVLGASWLALAVYHWTSVLPGPGTATRLIGGTIGTFAGFVQIGWLLLGIQGLALGRPITRRAFGFATACALAATLATWLFTMQAHSDLRFFVRTSVRGLLAAFAFLVAAGQVLWGRKHGIGRWLVASGFALYAVDLLQYFASLLPGTAPAPPLHLGYLDILAQMMMGLGMVILMLEDERERATNAVDALQSTQSQRLHSSKMEALGRMAGGVSHDFNNLLTAMRGHLELALERTEPSDQRRVDLEQAWRAAERACHLTQQLLSFSRSRQVGSRACCDVVAVLHELRPLLHRLVGPAIDIVYDLPETVVRAAIDRTGLEQVVFNLGANARDAMGGGGTLTVRVRAIPDLGRIASRSLVVLQVADTGCGMDEATRARMFDPFFTTKPPGLGTGLGLAQVYGIVQQAHGLIECSSMPGQGTTFAITLPASDRPLDVLEPAPGPAPAVNLLDSMRDQVIMLVDDDALVRQLLCRSLREHGYTVIEAGDPIDALALEAEFDEPIDLLITDLAMPKLSGIELADRICERRPAARVLFISGHAAAHSPSPHIELLQKPFAQTAFLARVEKMLATKAPLRVALAEG